MEIFKYIFDKRQYTARCIAGVTVLFIMLFAAAAQCDEIGDSLPPNSPEAVKASTRQAIQNGLEQENVVKLTRAMLQSKFNEQQIQLTHALMIEAKNSGMPVQPLMNKAFEGMAKNVSPPLIVGAMKTVQSRNAFAYQRAARLSKNKSHMANIGRALSAALAAGFSKEDADKITKMLQQQAKSMKPDQVYSLSLECFKTSRDVSRLGVSSPNVTNMVASALNKGFNHQDMHAMRSAFMTEARGTQPQELARSYSAAMQEGKGFQGGKSGGEGSDGSGHDTSGPGGSGGGSGDSGPGSGDSGSSGGSSGGGPGGSGGSAGSGDSGGPGPGGNQ